MTRHVKYQGPHLITMIEETATIHIRAQDFMVDPHTLWIIRTSFTSSMFLQEDILT